MIDRIHSVLFTGIRCRHTSAASAAENGRNACHRVSQVSFGPSWDSFFGLPWALKFVSVYIIVSEVSQHGHRPSIDGDLHETSKRMICRYSLRKFLSTEWQQMETTIIYAGLREVSGINAFLTLPYVLLRSVIARRSFSSLWLHKIFAKFMGYVCSYRILFRTSSPETMSVRMKPARPKCIHWREKLIILNFVILRVQTYLIFAVLNLWLTRP